jgi:hypothetical protein
MVEQQRTLSWRQTMRHYRYPTPRARAAFGVAAVVMSAMTIALFVVVPATLASASHDATAHAAAKSYPATPIEVAISPARIDVVGERTEQTAFKPAGSTEPTRAQRG